MDEKILSDLSSDSSVIISERKNQITNNRTEYDDSIENQIKDSGKTDDNSFLNSSYVELNKDRNEEFNKGIDKKNEKISPILSIRSSSISIVSTDESKNFNNSESDFYDETDDKNVTNSDGLIIQKLGHQITYPPNSENIPDINQNGLSVISQIISDVNGTCPQIGKNVSTSTKSQIGSIELNNSTDVTFGDKHFYEGPVTIQQFLIDSRKQNQKVESNSNENLENKPVKNIKTILKSVLNRRAAILTGIILGLTIFASLFITKWNPSNDNIGGGQSLRIVPRDAWLAQPPQKEIPKLKLPAKRVIISQTSTENCSTQAACTFRVRLLQTYHIESTDNDDIIFNFLIGGDGNVYEGRGWDTRGAHTKGYNDDSIGLSVIGTFKTTMPHQYQLNAALLLLNEGVKQNKLDPNYCLYGANQLNTTTSSLGNAFYELIQKWPHWTLVV